MPDHHGQVHAWQHADAQASEGWGNINTHPAARPVVRADQRAWAVPSPNLILAKPMLNPDPDATPALTSPSAPTHKLRDQTLHPVSVVAEGSW